MPTAKPPVKEDIRKTFANVYRTVPQIVSQAPGRVNLIGEHTDYNGGWVLPAPLPKFTQVAASPRPDRVVRAVSANMTGATATCEFQLDALQATGAWSDYLQGMCQGFAKRDSALSGMNLCIVSDVPLGGGLSSSAALNIAFGRAARELFNVSLTDTDLAHMAQQSEHDFVGAKVGMMDPMVISVGEMGHLLLLNTATLEHKSLPWPERLELAVVHSGVHHAHAAGAYNARRTSCEQAAQELRVKDLCKLNESHLPQIAMLPEPLGRRARHVVSENARVMQTVQALRAGDDAALKRLLYASHVSLRDDYEVSVPALDALVDTAMAIPTCLGARMTGGGFGGCMIMVSMAGHGAALVRDVLQRCHATAPQATAVFCGLLEV
jgi:galactokinase